MPSRGVQGGRAAGRIERLLAPPAAKRRGDPLFAAKAVIGIEVAFKVL